jgi:hypothetical protein
MYIIYLHYIFIQRYIYNYSDGGTVNITIELFEIYTYMYIHTFEH